MESFLSQILSQLQMLITTLAAAAVTWLCAYAVSWLRAYLGIKESDSNEEAIRRAALTEAGVLIKADAIADPAKVAAAAAKIIADLPKQVTSEGYNQADIKDMVIGAAATFFPPAALLKLFLK